MLTPFIRRQLVLFGILTVISLGTVPLVMVCPDDRNLPGFPVDTKSRYCSPTADTECTFATASIGIL